MKHSIKIIQESSWALFSLLRREAQLHLNFGFAYSYLPNIPPMYVLIFINLQK